MEEGHYRPRDAREARMWNYFNKQDLFWPIRLWPLWAQQDMMLFHKKYTQRYKLHRFLVFNGMNPMVAASWIYISDISGTGVPLAGIYDNSAVAQINGQIQQAKDGTLWKRSHRIFDMITRYPENDPKAPE